MTSTLQPDPARGAPEGANGDARLGRGVAAGSAVLAVAAALAVGDLVAALVSPGSSPFVAVGQGAIRLTPEPLKELAIAWFGVYDKVALLVGMTAVIIAITVAVGLASRRSPLPGVMLVLAMGVVGIVAVVSAPTFSPADVVAPAVALLAGSVAWRVLHARAHALARVARGAAAPTAAPPSAAPPSGPARRRLLLTAVGVAAGAGVAGGLGRLLSSGDPTAGAALPPARTTTAVPRAGADFTADGTPTWLTSNADFYRIDTALTVPRLTTGQWSLRLHGMVDREIRLSWDQLLARRLIEAPVTLTCVSNEVGGGLISNAVWRGAPLSELLAEAGVRPGAEQILATSSDGWNCNTPLGPLTDGRPAMLAVGMNGSPLPVEHGFPVRMVVPGLYGYVSACKWVTDIEVTTFDAVTSYWEQRGWGREGPIKTQSRIDVPRRDARVARGRVTVAGVAWAQHRGIDRVEVAVDEGPWQPTELASEPTADSWRMWRTAVTLPPGPHQLRVRATDRTGYEQTSAPAPSIPDGATGWHTVDVTAA